MIYTFLSRFEKMKHRGEYISHVLDIGAYRGDFTETINAIWPNAHVYQIEADNRQRPYLQTNAIIALVGDQPRDQVDFFTLSNDIPGISTTGSSVFRELSRYYTAESTVVLKKSMTTVDILDEKYNFSGDWQDSGLIKIDTQGSELLILEGAKNFLSSRKPRFILLECPVMYYNLGSPRLTDYFCYMEKIGYIVKDMFDQTYDISDNLIQIDFLFERQ